MVFAESEHVFLVVVSSRIMKYLEQFVASGENCY